MESVYLSPSSISRGLLGAHIFPKINLMLNHNTKVGIETVIMIVAYDMLYLLKVHGTANKTETAFYQQVVYLPRIVFSKRSLLCGKQLLMLMALFISSKSTVS